MTYQIRATIISYLAHEAVTKISIEQNDRVSFPTVTICSMNPLSLSRVREWVQRCDDEEDMGLKTLCDKTGKEINDIEECFRVYENQTETLEKIHIR